MFPTQILIDKALSLAEKQKGLCAPNPSVGAVIYNENHIISEGYHKGVGKPHAEVEALLAAKGDARGASMVVSLEPCNHQGRTPPCTGAILEAGLKEVYYLVSDANSKVLGKGSTFLNEKGCLCKKVEDPSADIFYEDYLYYCKTGRPYVRSKLAMSLDGKVGVLDKRLLLSSGKANAFTHQLRKKADAILTTSQTLLADNSKLNARNENETVAKNIFIIDSKNRMNASLEIHKTAQSIFTFSSGESLEEVITEIGKLGVIDLWVEAGPLLNQSLIEQNLLQRLYLYLCPKWIGEEGIAAFNSKTFQKIESARLREIKALEPDIVYDWEF